MNNVGHGERPMNRQQRAIVDGCFEEGQYEAGIRLLDKLRNEHVRPSSSHLLQLIYIALFPPPVIPDRTADKGKGKLKDRDMYGSPSKMSTAKRGHPLPTPEASQAALSLLMNFAQTNNPESLLRAIPSYHLSEAELATKRAMQPSRDMGYPDRDEHEDSQIAKDAGVLKECNDCWSMLKAGVVKRPDEWRTQRRDPGRSTGYRSQMNRTDDFDDSDGEEEDQDTVDVVGDKSWPLLDWFVSLFEREESLMQSDGRFSFSFFSQIKSSSNGPRWDVETPVEIVLYCCKQTDPRKLRLGPRLMALLVHQSNNPHFSSTVMLNLMTSRLRATSPYHLNLFLSNFPSLGRGLAFKLALCYKYFSDGPGIPSGPTMTRPQAPRARPMPGSPQKASYSGAYPTTQRPPSSTVSNTPLWPLPSAKWMVQFINSGSSGGSGSATQSLVKFHLFLSFGNLKSNDFNAQRTVDDVWVNALREDTFVRNLSEWLRWDAKGEEQVSHYTTMGESVSSMVNIWRQWMCGSGR
ncbi:hypothetical protein BD410DRAFT_784211 [Rickenella mellea]|uniref:Uncharacterized protein n=1 Tax=Rickenella mellea TaxID=50990 RepID=A0A4Y7QH19_9AGAM|nr:hypothetical protein BD410DRAFT_784211 [Rickenella mellea]